MPRRLRRIQTESQQPHAGARHCGVHVGKRPAVTGNHRGRRERLDQREGIQRGLEFGIVAPMRHDCAEAVLPQRIAGYQQLPFRAIKHQRTHGVPGRGQRPPGRVGGAKLVPRRDRVGEAERRRELVGVALPERLRIPRIEPCRLARRNRDRTAVARCHRGIAADMIGVPVGVNESDDVARVRRQQCQGLVGAAVVAGIDQHLPVIVGQQDLVAVQPAAHHNLDAGGQFDDFGHKSPF